MTEQDLRSELAAIHSQAHAWAVRCCRDDREEAEDVLHQAYIRVLDNRATFDGRSTFRTWFFGVVRMTAREQLRRGWLRLRTLERWWTQDPDRDPEPASDPDERVARLKEALARISKRQAEVLHLVFYQEMTIQEAADVLAMPVGTARTHYERGKTRLRQLLAEGGTV